MLDRAAPATPNRLSNDEAAAAAAAPPPPSPPLPPPSAFGDLEWIKKERKKDMFSFVGMDECDYYYSYYILNGRLG